MAKNNKNSSILKRVASLGLGALAAQGSIVSSTKKDDAKNLNQGNITIKGVNTEITLPEFVKEGYFETQNLQLQREEPDFRTLGAKENPQVELMEDAKKVFDPSLQIQEQNSQIQEGFRNIGDSFYQVHGEMALVQLLKIRNNPNFNILEVIRYLINEYKLDVNAQGLFKSVLNLGDEKIIDLFIEKVPNVNKIYINKDPILHYIISSDQFDDDFKLKITKKLFERGIDLKQKDAYGNTVLMIVVDYSKIEILDFLIKQNKILINSKDKDRNNALIESVLRSNLDEQFKLEILKKFVNDGIDLNYISETSHTSFMAAAELGYIKILDFLATQNKNLIEAKDIHGRNALTKAILSYYLSEESRLEVVQKLTTLGIDLNHKNKDGITAFMAAAKFCQIEILDFLMKLDKNLITAKDKNGNNALMVLILSKKLNLDKQSTLETVKKLVVEFGIDLNDREVDGSTAFLMEAVWGWTEILDFLMTQNQDLIKAENNFGNNVLMTVILSKELDEQSRLEAVKKLIEIGVDLEHRNKSGDTALNLASKHGRTKIVEFLKLELIKQSSKETSAQTDHAEEESSIKTSILTAAGGIVIIGAGAYLAKRFIINKADKKEEFDVLAKINELAKKEFNDKISLRKQSENIELSFGKNNSDKITLFGNPKIENFSKERFVEILLNQKLIPFLETQKNNFGKRDFSKEKFESKLKEVFAETKKLISHEHYFNRLKESLLIPQGSLFEIELQPVGKNQNLTQALLLKTNDSPIGVEETVTFNTRQIPVFNALRNSLKTEVTSLTIKASKLVEILQSEKEFNQNSVKNIAEKILKNSNEYQTENKVKKEESERLEQERLQKARLTEEKRVQEIKDQEAQKKQEAERKAAQKAAQEREERRRINEEKERREEEARVEKEREKERKRAADLEKETKKKEIANVDKYKSLIKEKFLTANGLQESFVSFGSDPTKFNLSPSLTLEKAKKDLEFSTEKFQYSPATLSVVGDQITLQPDEVKKAVENLAKKLQETAALLIENNIGENGNLIVQELLNNPAWQAIEESFLKDLIKSSQEYQKHQKQEEENKIKEGLKKARAAQTFLSKTDEKLESLTKILTKLDPSNLEGKDKLIEAMLFAAADFAEFLHKNKDSEEAKKLKTILDFDEFYNVLRLPIVKNLDIKDDKEYLSELIIKKDLLVSLNDEIKKLQNPSLNQNFQKIALVSNVNKRLQYYSDFFTSSEKGKEIETEFESEVFSSEEKYTKVLKDVTKNIHYYSEDLKNQNIGYQDKILTEKALRFNVARFGDLIKSNEQVVKEFQSKNSVIFNSLLDKSFLKGARNELWHGRFVDAALDVVKEMAQQTNVIFELLNKDQLEKAGIAQPSLRKNTNSSAVSAASAANQVKQVGQGSSKSAS